MNSNMLQNKLSTIPILIICNRKFNQRFVHFISYLFIGDKIKCTNKYNINLRQKKIKNKLCESALYQRRETAKASRSSTQRPRLNYTVSYFVTHILVKKKVQDFIKYIWFRILLLFKNVTMTV